MIKLIAGAKIMKSELCAPVMMELDSTLLNFKIFLYLYGLGKQKLQYFKKLNKGFENVSLDITNYILFGSFVVLHAISGFFFPVKRPIKCLTLARSKICNEKMFLTF